MLTFLHKSTEQFLLKWGNEALLTTAREWPSASTWENKTEDRYNLRWSVVALNSQRQDSTLYSWSRIIIGALWFPSKYKVYKKSLLLLFIPVGHHALKSSLLTLYLAGSEHSNTPVMVCCLLFFLRKAKKPIYVKTRKDHFWLTTHFFLDSCKGHLSCLSIRTCGSSGCTRIMLT